MTLSKTVLKRTTKEIFPNAGVSESDIDGLKKYESYNVKLIDETIKLLP